MSSSFENSSCLTCEKVRQEYGKHRAKYQNLNKPNPLLEQRCLFKPTKLHRSNPKCGTHYYSLCKTMKSKEENVENNKNKGKQIFEKCLCQNNRLLSKTEEYASNLKCSCIKRSQIVYYYRRLIPIKEDFKIVNKKCSIEDIANDTSVASYSCYFTDEELDNDLEYPCENLNSLKKKNNSAITHYMPIQTVLSNRLRDQNTRSIEKKKSFKSRIQRRSVNLNQTNTTTASFFTTMMDNVTSDFNLTTSNSTLLPTVTPEFYEFITPEIIVYERSPKKLELWYHNLINFIPIFVLFFWCYCVSMKSTFVRACRP